MTEDCCIYCSRQEDGKPVTVCSRCLQLTVNAKPEAVTAFILKHKMELTEQQLDYLENITDEEIHYEHKTRPTRKNLVRERIGRAAKPAHQKIRQMRPRLVTGSGADYRTPKRLRDASFLSGMLSITSGPVERGLR